MCTKCEKIASRWIFHGNSLCDECYTNTKYEDRQQ